MGVIRSIELSLDVAVPFNVFEFELSANRGRGRQGLLPWAIWSAQPVWKQYAPAFAPSLTCELAFQRHRAPAEPAASG